MTAQSQTRLPDAPAAAARLIEPILAQVAGPGAEPVSLTLDYGVAAKPGDPVTVEAAVDRATRTLVFATARLVDARGGLIASASAVFRRLA